MEDKPREVQLRLEGGGMVRISVADGSVTGLGAQHDAAQLRNRRPGEMIFRVQ